MNLVVPFGFYGSGNIGDEATLQGFARLLALHEVDANVAIASRNPRHTSRIAPGFSHFNWMGNDPRRWWAKFRATADVYAGGTPVMDVLGDWPLCEVVPQIRSARRRKVPVVFVGIGAEELRLEKSRKVLADEVIPFVKHWSVRSSRDRQRLIEYGVDPATITVAADMAWLIEPADLSFGKSRLRSLGINDGANVVAVNVVNENEQLQTYPHIVSAIAGALDELVAKQKSTILFISNEIRTDDSFDLAAAKMVMREMKNPVAARIAPNDYLSPREMMSIIGCCSTTISMRYHVCLFSALQNVPFVALTRADKVSDLCWDLDWPGGIKPVDATAEKLLSLHATVSEISGLPDRVEKMRTRAADNIASLAAIGCESGRLQPSLA
jgi:polysaccharide pyruvyl transferase WcaK-like protein